jgi:mono/diheme cytochrome c family protein
MPGSASAQQVQKPRSAEEALFEENCGVCHNNPATRAPARASLHAMSTNFIVEALTNGIMKTEGSSLSAKQRVSLAEFLADNRHILATCLANIMGMIEGPVTLSDGEREKLNLHFQAAATAVRHVSIAAARTVRCVRAEVRWRWT